MGLLDDFKTKTGATETDQYLIDYYLKPALDKASSVTNNKRKTVVTLTQGVNSYDLTNASIASPVVTGGIQQISIDDDYQTGYVYKDHYYFSDPTTMYFVNADIASGDFEFNYFAYYTIPDISGAYVETDLPFRLFPALLRYANGLYAKDKINDYSNIESGGIQSKSEYNLSVSYGSQDIRIKALDSQMNDAVNEMKVIGGWSSRILMYQLQIV